MARMNKKVFSTSGIKVTFIETEFDSDKNPLFSKVKINFLYKGYNRNGSYISKRVAENIGKKIAYIPIVGEFITEKEDFGTHGGKLTITSDDIVYEETTVPYGVVGAAENLWWEEVEDEDGKMVNYLTTWGYLWTKRYPDAEKVLSNNNWQSMELDPSSVEGRWIQKKGEEEFTFHIDDALISAFCILGEDIAPAFEDSQVTQFELMREAIIGKKFKEEFEEMKNDFKDFLFTLGGKEQIDIDSNDNDLEGGTDSMLYKLNIENPSSVFSSLNVEEEASKIVISETEDTVVYFDLEDQKFYTRKFSLNEEEILEWAEDAEVIEFGLVPDTAVLEEAITTLKTTVTDFELEVEKKDTTIGELESSIVTLQGSVNTYEVLEKEIVLEAKKEIINEFREQVSEEDIESIESEIENFSAEEIKSKLALIVYELSKEEIDGDNPEPKFTHKPKGSDNGSTPAWFNEVVKNIKK